MANTKIAYGAATNITCTLASLATGSARECTAIINSTNLFLDAEVYLAIKLGAGVVAADERINVHFYASMDGTNYDENVTGVDAALTLRAPSVLRGPFAIPTVIAAGDSATFKAIIPSVAKFFDGVLPYNWGFVIENQSGLALSSAEGNHT